MAMSCVLHRFTAEVLDAGRTKDFVFNIPAAFYCSEGCGGGLVSNDSIHYYNYGTCVAMDQCQCKTKPNSTELAYGLNNCSKVLCNPECKNGYCGTPDNCVCETGWSGDDCGVALCLMLVAPPCVYLHTHTPAHGIIMVKHFSFTLFAVSICYRGHVM